MRAGAYAAGLARRQHARLICLYVRSTRSLAGLSPGLAGPLREATDALVSELRDTMESGARRLGIVVVFMERAGNPGSEIARVADELAVDAVVVGASMQAGHRFVGSIAGQLVRVALAGHRRPVVALGQRRGFALTNRRLSSGGAHGTHVARGASIGSSQGCRAP